MRISVNCSAARVPKLLQNMSVAPKTTISMQPGATRNYGHGIAFALPHEFHGLALDEVLAAVRKAAKLRTTSEKAIRDLLDAHAIKLTLPAVAAVTDRACAGDAECHDLLTIAAVLAKSSSRVYLRDKEPNLAAIVPGRRVVLVVPKEIGL